MKQFAKYSAIGLFAALIEWTLFYFLKTHFQYNIAFLIAFTVATTIHYFLTIRLVFTNSKFRQHQEIMFVILVAGVGLIINTIALNFFIQIFDLDKMVSKILATGTAFLWNYLARKHLVFAK
ncbi:MAG: GtrA family protein [Bacteroidetes bacterium]|nr:GtrA family protein [Bacteroidota bacterium]